ncbi:MAG: tetratricopeptide repeat protein [Oscillospiraceae bacterium]|nr:tetratricopeptide repeat protein [Oscillospiraceae bacterium]
MIFAAVTKNFIAKRDDPFVEHVIEFAVDKHTFVPIMAEKGLEGAFNNFREGEKYKNIQLLDIKSLDPTQISYLDKMEKLLPGLLLSDELLENIKKEFKSYIFLSYRKKDREHAQKLMRLIHSNKKYHNIAIWYDEFLVPGEAYTEAIKESLDNCSVFMLAVTPNILEIREENGKLVPNFVMEKEYPRAAELKKVIFPAELVPTDKEELKEKFSGLAECASIDDEEAFWAKLAPVLDGIDVSDSTPEHDYLIGLAYLHGINVEKNEKIALELITSSAERGYIPAMEKIQIIYYCGSDVDINLYESIKWSRRLVKLYEEKLDNSAEDVYKWCFYQQLIADMMEMMSQSTETTLKTMDVFYAIVARGEEAVKKYGRNDKLCLQLSVTYLAIGQHWEVIDKTKSLIYLGKAYDTVTQLEKLSSKEIDGAVIIAANIAGTLYELGRYDEAIKYCLKAIEFRNKHLADERADLHLGQVYCCAGSSFNKLNNKEAAEEYLKKGEEIAEKVYKVTDMYLALATEIECCDHLGVFYCNMGRLDDGEKAFKKMFSYAKEGLWKWPLTASIQVFGECGMRYGNFLENTRNEREACNTYIIMLDCINTNINYYQGSPTGDMLHYMQTDFIKIWCLADKALERIFNKASSYDDRLFIASSLDHMGELSLELNMFDKAISYYSVASNTFEQLYNESEDIELLRKAINCYYKLGIIYKDNMADEKAAESRLEIAKNLYPYFLARGAQTPVDKNKQIQVCEELASIYASRGEYSRAQKYLSECIKNRLMMNDKFNEKENLKALANDYCNKAALTYRLGGNVFEVITFYQEARNYCDKLISIAPTKENIALMNLISNISKNDINSILGD